MLPSFPTIDLDWRKEIAVLKLNRAHVLNALNRTLADELLARLKDLRASNTRVLILKAEGRAFSAGGDVREMKAAADQNATNEQFFQPIVRILHECILIIRNLPMPVIAAVNGSAAGGACNLALACDFVIAGETARFNQAFVRIGLTPDCGGTFILPRLIGWRRATQLLMTGDFLDAQTAEEIGMITCVVPDHELEQSAFRLATKLADGPTAAFGRIKRLLNESAINDYATQLEAEYQTQLESSRTQDFVEGINAFLEKRDPEFGGR